MNNITNRQDTLTKILSGINQLADEVKTTSGSKGKTYLIRKPDGTPHLTKDGVTIAKAIRCDDPVEQLGATLLQQAAQNTVDTVGDGTTATITIAQALANEIIKVKDYDSRVLLEEVDAALSLILKELSKQRYKVKSLKDCVRVATVATNNDAELGELIGNVVWAAKDNGVILFEESEKTYTEVVQEKGSKYQKSYEWKKFLGKNEIRTAFENPLIHVFENDVQDYNMIAYSIKESFETGRPLVLLAPDYAKFVINELYRQYQAGLKILPLITPGYGDEIAEYRKDIEAIVKDDNVYRVVASKFDFTLYTRDYTSHMQDRTDYVLNQIGNETTQYYKEVLERRLSILNQKVFTVHVGAPSQVEMLELKDRMEDGLLATRSAYDEGYVLGGGIALRNVFQSLNIPTNSKGAIASLNAIITPYIQIIKNAGYPYQVLTNQFGIDTNTGEVTDFKKAGIYDSYGAIRQSVINAFSVIKTIIQLNGVILDNQSQKKVQFVANEGFAEV